MRILVYIFCLIIIGLSLSDEANKMKFLNIERAEQFLDCKTVVFFLKISKEIGKAWRKSLTCAKPTRCF